MIFSIGKYNETFISDKKSRLYLSYQFELNYITLRLSVKTPSKDRFLFL